MKEEFELRLIRLHWIKDDGKDDPQDLCAHGVVYLRIAGELLSNESSVHWTVSSTALFLMRTLFQNYEMGDFSSQLLPCCGHFFIPNEGEQSVNILGCPNGIDWSVKHLDNHKILCTTSNGGQSIIDFDVYKKLVLTFANEVEKFYNRSLSKEIPTDAFDRRGYRSFWTEWNILKTRIEDV